MEKRIDNNSDVHPVKKSRYGTIAKWVLRIPLFFIVGVMFLIGAGFLFLQTDFVRDILRTYLIETANRQLNATVGIDRIDGTLLTGISLEGLSVRTPDEKPVLFIERISASYALPMLLEKVIYVKEARIKGLRLNMVKSPGGIWNISTLQKPSDKKEKSGGSPLPFLVAVKRFEIADALFVLEESDKGVTTNRSLQIDRFAARAEYEKTLQLSILESAMTFKMPEAIPIALNGQAFFDPKTIDVKIDPLVIQSGPSTIKVGGGCRFQGKTPAIDCAIDLDSVDLGDIGRRLLISGLPQVVVSGDIKITGTPSELHHRVNLKEGGAVLETSGSTGFDDAQGFWTELSGHIRTLDLSKLGIPAARHFSGIVSTDISVRGKGLQKPETMTAGASIDIRGVSAVGIPLDLIRLKADMSHGKVSIDQLEALSGKDRIGLSGSIEPFDRRSGLDFTLHIEEPEVLMDRLSKHLPQMPASLTLKGETVVTAAVNGWVDDPQATISLRSGEISYDRIQAKTVHLTGIWQGLPGPENRIDDLRLTIQKMGLSGIGTGTFSLTGSWGGWTDNPNTRFSIEVGNVSGDRLNINRLDLAGNLEGHPGADGSRAGLTLSADGVRVDRIASESISLEGSWRGPFSQYTGHAELNAHEIDIQNNLFKDLLLTADVAPDESVLSVTADQENGSRLEIDGKAIQWRAPEKDFAINKLILATHAPWPELNLKNREPIRVSLTGNNEVEVHSCHIELNDSEIGIEGTLKAGGEQNLKLAIDDLELSDIPGKWNSEARLSGTVSMKTDIRGTLGQPIISSHVNVENLLGYGISQATNLDAAVDYTGEKATFQATLSKQGTPVLSASGNAPVQFSLAPFSAVEAQGNLDATLETSNLKFSELPIPPIKGVGWDAVADIKLHVTGSFRDPELSGNIAIHDGHLTLTRNKLTYEKVSGKLLLSNDRLTIEELTIAGDREGRLNASGTVAIGGTAKIDTDLVVNGDNFYIPFQEAVSARISPKLHLTGGVNSPSLKGEVTITESKINLDRLAQQQHSDIQVVEAAPEGGDEPLEVSSDSKGPNYLSRLSADIRVHVPKNAWLKGQDVNAEIAGDITVEKRAGGPFLLSGPLRTLRGNYYFMGKNFRLIKGEVEFLGLKEINPNLNIETQTRIKKTNIIVSLHGPANEITIDLSSDPVMPESDIISFLLFGRASDSLGGDKAFNVEKAALSYTSGLLAGELRNLLGDVFFIDSFAIESGDDESGFGAVTFGKYITPEIFISHRQGLSENDPSYEEITYELTPQLKLDAQIGRDDTSGADLTWDFDF